MSDGRRTFIDRVLAGEVHDPENAIHAEIDALQIEHPDVGGDMLCELLGLTRTEWRSWLHKERRLVDVLAETRGYKR